jgi:hypothetical protein
MLTDASFEIYYRANAVSRHHKKRLISAEFLAIIKKHLKPGGVFFYNTTDSARVQRTGCLAFPYGARFTNHMVALPHQLLGIFSGGRRRSKAIALTVGSYWTSQTLGLFRLSRCLIHNNSVRVPEHCKMAMWLSPVKEY